MEDDGYVLLYKKLFGDTPSKEAINRLRAALYELTPRLREVLGLRFGIWGQPPKTLRDVGQQIPSTHNANRTITKGRVLQMEKKAILILRHPKFGIKEN